MKTLPVLPRGLEEILKVYGNPDADHNFVLDVDWYVFNTALFELPFPLRLAWGDRQTIDRIRAHKLVGDVIVDALIEIGEQKSVEWLRENNLDLYGGCFCFRKMTNGDYLSTHSWGIAIDLVPHLGPYGKEPLVPQFIVQAFKKRGFEWGGDWKAPDGMHFQACTGY